MGWLPSPGAEAGEPRAANRHSGGMKLPFISTGSVSTRLRLAVCVVAAVAFQVASAQTTVRDDDRGRTRAGERVKLKNPDRKFVEKVTEMSMEEMQISQVAIERTSNPRVKAFADALAADHHAMTQELNALAADKGVPVPAKENRGEKWLKRDAKSFDADYLKKMLSNHEETVKLFQKQARDGEDPELVAFARKHLPTLQKHLQEASDLHKMLKD